MQVETYFDNIQHQIKLSLLNATQSIKIAVAYFTDNEIFSLLCDKASNGITVELIISDEDVNFKFGNISFDALVKNGGRLFISVNEDRSILHNKFCIIDDNIVITGSYNWSNQAKKNHENIVSIEGIKDISAKFLVEFERIKSMSSERVQNRDSFILQSGWPSFDSSFGGFHSASINIICSTSQDDSTSFLLSIINKIIQTNEVAFLSLSDDITTVANRLLSLNSGVSLDKIKRGNIEGGENFALYKEILRLSDKNLLIGDLTYPSLTSLKENINRLRYKKNLQLIVIDKIERVDQVNTATYSSLAFKGLEPFIIEIKRLSLEINIPIICSLTIAANGERRNQRIYSNELGSIENHADAVFELYGEEYYDTSWGAENVTQKKYLLHCLKHRHSGSLGRLTLMQDIVSKKFTDDLI